MMNRRESWQKWFKIGVVPLLLFLVVAGIASRLMAQEGEQYEEYLDGRSLDGSENNQDNPQWGMAGEIYKRVAGHAYDDDLSTMDGGPDPRYISNRIYNDEAVNLFSENGVTHWGFVWGQFLDHSIGLRQTGGEEMIFPFDAEDPLEAFQNDLGGLSFERSAAAPGTGSDSPREQVNTLSSFIDAFAVYGGNEERLDWLRAGPLDGDPNNNQAGLLMSADGYLPTATSRGDAASAPQMELMGALIFDPDSAVVAGDMRANENLGLTAVQTLFAREHNRIVAELPEDLPEEVKFAIARRVVGATQQVITYEEFLPAFGVTLESYAGYDPEVDPTISNEFATVGYRAHSMIHGEFEMAADAANYSAEQLQALEEDGIDFTVDGDEVEFAIPLNVAFGRPYLLPELGLPTVLLGLASEPQYANDAMIDNQLRSVLFQIPSPTSQDPMACLDGEELPDCFTVVNDLGVIDVVRGYDHGIPNYNELRAAYGLEPKASFMAITGESSEQFPDDPLIDDTDAINDPDILDFVALFDAAGEEIPLDAGEAGPAAFAAVQRTTLAARLAAVYGSVDELDAFTGMMAEEHIPGTEFGELQLAMWTQQFSALRDGDRFFYVNDPVLDNIAEEFGIDYHQTLAEVIANNTELQLDEIPVEVFVTEIQESAQSVTPVEPDGLPQEGGTESQGSLPRVTTPGAQESPQRPGERRDRTRPDAPGEGPPRPLNRRQRGTGDRLGEQC